MTDAAELTRRLKAAATDEGFRRAAACPASEPAGYARLSQWLERGYAGEMEYLSAREQAYRHPRHVLEGARSVVMLAMDYRTQEPREPSAGEGRVSRYAWGERDYHDLIHPRLKRLVRLLQELAPGCQARGVVDTAPLLEREFAQLAGLGWVGKNTLLLDPQGGSWFFLAALLTDVELEYDEPFESDHCGQCTACLDACPTDAFPQPYVLDARRCISYLTIELRSPVPSELREGIGDWLFGCDVCQDVCPWNRHSQPATEPALARETLDPCQLAELFELDDESFRERFRPSPLWRPRRRGLLRNAAIVLGNQRHAAATPALLRGLGDSEPLVRGASAWALGRLGGAATRAALQAALSTESDAQVLDEIRAALQPGE